MAATEVLHLFNQEKRGSDLKVFYSAYVKLF